MEAEKIKGMSIALEDWEKPSEETEKEGPME